MTCKDCIHYCLCKDTLADENWREDTPQEIKDMYSPKGCENFKNEANFVKVVMCKDCRMFVENKEAFVAYCKRELKNLCVKPDDYCSYGEMDKEKE
jgi:hypothetical protein